MKRLFQMTRALVARKRKIFALFFALAASVGLSWAGVAVDGRLPGEFSIAKNKKVYFSQGNLQYNKSTKKWSFMTNQYDRVETDMQEVGTNYANQNIVSFFCWGNGNNPTGTSESNKQKFTDYGINPISNGGNAANIWRTLSEAEWVYMLNQYNNANYRQGNRFAKAKLFGTTYGLIVFPDSYSHPSGVTAVTGINKTDGTSWNANQYSAADWAKMEAAGCVFLPAAGIRWGTMIRFVNTEAGYWTSTPVDNTYAKYEVFTQNNFVSVSKEDRNGYGMSVRLVLDKAYYKVNYTCPDKTSGTVPSDATSYLKGSLVTVKGAGDLAKTGYIFAGWTNGSTAYIGGQTFNILANTTLTAQWTLDMGPVNNVIALINAIGTVTYPGSGDKITAAREAYDALTVQAQKDAVANYATLTDAEAAYLALQPDVVAGKIDAIGEVAYTAECKAKIDEARAAYDALPPATQAQVGNYAKLQAAEATYAQLLAQAVKAVKDQIDALPATPLTAATKKLSEYNKVKAARAAYDALSDAEKAAVSNYDKLTAAEAAFAAIDAGSPLADAQAAVDLINVIPSPVAYDVASKNAIDAARAAVNALGANASLIDDADLQKLTDAEAAYAQLLTEAVNAVKDQIDALPATPLQDADKKLSEYNKVKAARAAYDALLNADDKALVTNLAKLEEAEAAFAAISGGGGSAPDGALNGAFTINAGGDQIVFSKGNLQYQASTTTLRFATNQYDMIGADNANISDTYTGWIDLFGWGTGNHPAYSSTVDEDYSTFTDWGTNAISNGGNEANLWRTMTVQEWNHLIKNRTNAAHLKGHATVADVHGYVLLPDSWTLPAGLSFTANPNNWTTNVYTAEQWAQMEAAGAVFLPAAGYREPEIEGVGEKGWYWASTVVSDAAAYCFEYDETTARVFGSRIYFGQPVRLVAVAAPSPLADAQAVKDLIDAIPQPVVYTPECKEAIKAAREALDALSDEAKALFATADTAALPAAETAYAGLLAEKVAPVIAAIDAVPATPLTDATKKLSEYNKVTDARALYDALATDEEKAAVTNYEKLTAAEAAFAAISGGGDAGALSGKFSIDESSVVYFSKGNLQATTTDLGANWTWAFAANQYDYIGNAAANNAINGNGTVSTNGTIDLFGWSTSTTFYGIHNSTDNGTYYASFVDWSSNTDLIASLGEGWRTLTSGEWTYLLNTRTTTSGVRYAKATVNTVAGLIILPDNWNEAYHALASTNNPDVDFNGNEISSAEWASDFQAHGAVFLPAAGLRNGTNVSEAGSAGYYWSATSIDAYTANYMYINDSELSANSFNLLHYGRSVRLVTETAPASPLADAQAAKDLIDAIGEVSYPDSKEAIKAAREALDALSDEAKALFNEADTAALPAAEAAYADLLAQKVAPVIAAIDAVPATPLTDATAKLSEYNKVTDARALYDALATDEEKAAVTNYDKLTAAEAAFAAIPSVGGETVITWDKNTGIGKISGTATSPAYEGITISINGGGFSPEGEMLRFNIAGLGLSFEFANTLGVNFQKIVISSTNAMPATPLAGMGEGWAASNENKTATWTGDAATVKIWDGLTATSYWDVNTIQFTLGATVSATEAAQAALDKINAIPSPVVVSDECNAAIKAAREAVTALGENASLLDDADIAKLTQAEADFAELIKDATAVVAKIDAIGEVTFSPDCKAKIVDAREAYDALSDELKPYVSNLATLTAAEGAYEAARPFASVTTVPAAVEALQYTGAAQALITAGAAEHGTVLYSLDGETYSAELPTALLAGAYTVYYKVQATDDYKDVAPATVIATIAYNYPATYSLFGIPEGWSVKVNDEEVAVVNGAVKNIAANDRFDIMPVKPEDVKLVEVVPYLLDLATATDSVIYLMNGDSITGTANGNISIVIVPDAKVYFKDVKLTNTGSHPAVLCGGNAEMVVVGENTITCTTEGEYGIRTAGAGTTLTISGDKTQLSATIDPNGGTVNQ